MNTKKILNLLFAAVLLSVMACNAPDKPSEPAETTDVSEPIKVSEQVEPIAQYNNVLYKDSLDESDGSEVQVREAYFPAGWKAPRHYHNSHLFLYIVEGEFELIMGEAGKVVYKAGDALQMNPGIEMDARNPSDVNPLKIAVFQVGKPNEPFVVPVE